MTFIEFMQQHIGARWVVVSRRTKNLQRRYADRTLLTRRQYNALAKQYEAETGHRHW